MACEFPYRRDNFANYYYKCMLIIVTPSRGRCMGTFVIIMEQRLLKLGMSSAVVEQYGVARTANVKLFLRLMFSPLLTKKLTLSSAR